MLVVAVFAYPFCIQAQLPPAEREALQVLYTATGGLSWERRDGWLGPSGSECSEPGWFGLHCDEQGTHVVTIELPANHLTGFLPPQIVDLSNLKVLRLSNNSLTGTIPATLGSLRSLEILYLDGNSLIGPIPEEITELPSLRELHLNRNRLSGSLPAQWGERSLESIDFSTNSLSGVIPESLGELPLLHELRLAGNKLVGAVPTSFAQLFAAQTIDLRWNALSVEEDELTKFLSARSPDGNVLNTQTLPPTALTVSLFSPGVFLATWHPPLYTANEGGYELKLDSNSGHQQRLRFPPKTASKFGFIGLRPGDYSLVLSTFTLPHAANPNEVVSSPSAPALFAGPPPQPGSISFSFPEFLEDFSVAEGEIAYSPVFRSGGADGKVSVRARAVPRSAGPEDFSSTPQILSWEDGEDGFRFVEVSTVADNMIEGPEQVGLILDQPQGGAILGPLVTASLEILDGDVSGFGSEPVAARDPEGNGLFVWIAPERSGTTAVFGRFADPRGKPVGRSFQISEESPDLDEQNPGVVSVKIDHFEVTWQEKKGAVRRCVIRVRGRPRLGKQLPVAPLVAADSLKISGDPGLQRFALAWASAKRILSIMFDEEERPSPIIRIDGPQPGRPRRPALALSSRSKMGLFLWEQEEAGGEVNIWGRLFTFNGVASGSEFRVNRETAGPQTLPQLTATASGFFAVWRSPPLGPSADPSGTELRGVPFRARREEPGVEFRVNREAIGSQEAPSVTTDERGNCVVGWLREGAEVNGLFLRTLRGCGNSGPAEKAVRVFRNRSVRTPRLFRADDATGVIFGIVERDGGISVETVKDKP